MSTIPTATPGSIAGRLRSLLVSVVPVALCFAVAGPSAAQAPIAPRAERRAIEIPIVLPATATASSTGAAGPASFAVDGNLLTRWESQHGIDPSSLTLDFGGARSVVRVVIHWEAANAGSYTIDGSSDGVNWVTLASRSGGLFGDRTDVVPVRGVHRYVRMNGLTRSAGNNWGYSIWEMEVLGGRPLDSDGDGVDDTSDLCPGTPPGTPVDPTGCPIVISGPEVAHAAGLLVGGANGPVPGYTLYVTDDDLATPGASSCTGPCESTWPPVLVTDGEASGVPGLSTITRPDGSQQATFQGRPLYSFIGDAAPGTTAGEGVGGVWSTVPYAPVLVPLFGPGTALEPPLQEETPTALVTRFADRARDRHAREDQFQAYDHYLSFYWEHRTTAVEIVDTVGRGGSTVTFDVASQWRLNPTQAELRFLYRGINTVAEYFDNGIMQSVPSLNVPGSNVKHYTRSIGFNQKEGRPLQVGDRLEFELSQFLDGVPNGRNNYYGTAILYVVGEGIRPWEARGVFGDPSTEREDSYPLPEVAWTGGGTTLPYQYSDEPDNRFMQMAGNLSSINGQAFVEGRRVHHTDVGDGSHDEGTQNPPFGALAGLLGPSYTARSCVACHDRNGRALPASPGETLEHYVVMVGDAAGAPHPTLGRQLQPRSTAGAPEGEVLFAGWTPVGALRRPEYAFVGETPDHFSARLAPQIVGMGLLEAIMEADVESLADPNDADGDGISGRMRLVTDPETFETRLGRFGWKASQPSVRHQVAAALNGDMGPGLASTLIEGDALPSEWRTAPLWSLGLTAGVSGGEAYLHDGRARTIEEAILWHDGEAAAARAAYEALTPAEKASLEAFLRSL